MYCPLPTSEEDALAAEEDEEIFLNDDSARYYNLSSSDQRRHSIGTFMTRDRSTSFASGRSFRDEVPSALIHATASGDSVKSVAASVTIDDHSLRHGSYPRNRCSRCTRGKFFCGVKIASYLEEIVKNCNHLLLSKVLLLEHNEPICLQTPN